MEVPEDAARVEVEAEGGVVDVVVARVVAEEAGKVVPARQTRNSRRLKGRLDN